VFPSDQPSAIQQLLVSDGNRMVFGTIKAKEGKLLDDISMALLDTNENVVATTMSGPEGKYQFTDIAPGDYFVEATYPTDDPYIISANVDFSTGQASEEPSMIPSDLSSSGPSQAPIQKALETAEELSMLPSDLPSS
jgi:uncharacterized surface anchored protein